MKEALYYKQLPEKEVLCLLCPHSCRIKNTERGRCRVRENNNGKLYTLVYGKPSAVHIDPIEKKPFYHFMPGTLAFSIGTAGCNQRCRFCQNWAMSQANPEETEQISMGPKKAVEEALRGKCKSIAYTYNEPAVFIEYMLDTAKPAKEKKLKNVMHTCGLINEAPLNNICRYMDAANIDLKYFSDKLYREISEGYLKPVLNTIKTLRKNKVWIEITNLVIPTINDDEKMIRKMCEWVVKNTGKETPLHFSRFFPMYKMQNIPPTPLKTLVMAKEIAEESGLKNVHLGNV